MSDFEKIQAREAGLHKKLTARQMSMIAIGGAIGTGLFLGSKFAMRLRKLRYAALSKSGEDPPVFAKQQADGAAAGDGAAFVKGNFVAANGK